MSIRTLYFHILQADRKLRTYLLHCIRCGFLFKEGDKYVPLYHKRYCLPCAREMA